jgi:hypothetical protein
VEEVVEEKEVLESVEVSAVETVEAEDIQIADSPEQAMELLKQKKAAPVAPVAPATISDRGTQGTIESVDVDNMIPQRAMSVASMKKLNAELDSETNVMTGDDLDGSKFINAHGNTIALNPIAQNSSEVKPVDSVQQNAFIANPPVNPNGSVKPPVSTGTEGVIQTNPPAPVESAKNITAPSSEGVQVISSIQGPGPIVTTENADGREVQVITGDNLSPIQTSKPSVATGKGKEVFQGTPSQSDVTIDQIVRASTPAEAARSIERCTDLSTLKVAKNTLKNMGKQDLIDKVELREQRLRSRGY